MKIEKVIIYHVDLPMKFTFRTAKETLSHRESLILKVVDTKGNAGYGETVSFTTPFYTDETLDLSQKVLRQTYVPAILGREMHHPFEMHALIERAYPMAAAGLENALLDIYAKEQNRSIISSIFNEKTKSYVDMGIVLGDIPYPELIEKIEKHQRQGCRRFKIKVKPEDGYERVKKTVEQFPKLKFAIDANRSYAVSQIKEVKKFDDLNLLCIEEPFMASTIEACRNLQQQIKTPICLDESIQTMEELKKAVSLNTFQVLNIKVGRVGGLYYAKQMIDFCRKNHIGYWIGSMVESGISKILHVQLAGLMDTYMAGDLSDSKRYFKEDFIKPEILFVNGKMPYPQGTGLGVQVDEETIKKRSVESWIMKGSL